MSGKNCLIKRCGKSHNKYFLFVESFLIELKPEITIVIEDGQTATDGQNYGRKPLRTQ